MERGMGGGVGSCLFGIGRGSASSRPPGPSPAELRDLPFEFGVDAGPGAVCMQGTSPALWKRALAWPGNQAKVAFRGVEALL